MSSSIFNHRSANNDHSMRRPPYLATITDDDRSDPSLSDSTGEPSLANSSVSYISSSSRIESDKTRQGPLHSSLPFHSHSSLLDITRDESHDEDDVSLDLIMDGSHRSPDASLLDADATILEEGGAQSSLVNFTESLSGSFCTQGNEINTSCNMPDCAQYISGEVPSDKGLFTDKILQNRVMSDINYLLGSSDQVCCSERNLFSKCLTLPSGMSAGENEMGEIQIRNRAGESWRARAYRIKRLRQERMIQDSATAMRNTNLDINVGNSGNIRRSCTSFSHHKPIKPTVMKPKQEVNVEALGCIIGDCIEPISLVEGNDVDIEWKDRQEYMDEQDLCYDSDPGIYHGAEQRTSTADPNERTTRGLHGRSISDQRIDAGKSPSSPMKWFKSPTRRRRKMHFDSFDSIESEQSSKRSCANDDELDLKRANFYGNVPLSRANTVTPTPVVEDGEDSFYARTSRTKMKTARVDREILNNVQNALNESWTLTWHLPSKASPKSTSINKKPTLAPRCVQLWFERGNRIRRNDIVEPKLMWRDAYHPDLASQRKLNFSTTKGPHQICLLSICRIIEAQKIDRKKYPFVKKSCSFLIRTSDDEEFVFEAMSQKQRDHIVHMWKLVVARLASQAVVGDGEGMVGEFFVPASFGVQ